MATARRAKFLIAVVSKARQRWRERGAELEIESPQDVDLAQRCKMGKCFARAWRGNKMEFRENGRIYHNACSSSRFAF